MRDYVFSVIVVSTAGDGWSVPRRGPYRVNYYDEAGTQQDALSLKQLNFSTKRH